MPIRADVKLGARVTIHHAELVNLYGCTIGDDSRIGSFVEIQRGASVGARCKVSSHSFVCEGVTIEDEVFVGHGVMFINDRYRGIMMGVLGSISGAPSTSPDAGPDILWKLGSIRIMRARPRGRAGAAS